MTAKLVLLVSGMGNLNFLISNSILVRKSLSKFDLFDYIGANLTVHSS